MVVFVSGGSGSGKSAFAEELVMNSGYEKRSYIATMNVWDKEGEKRVQRHREMRRHKGFDTVERPHDLLGLEPPRGAVLLEDLTNLFMNEYFNISPGGAVERVEQALLSYAEKCDYLVIVSNDIFRGGDRLEGDMADFYDKQGRLNSFAARLADECYEVDSMYPVKHMGQMPAEKKGLTLILGGASQGKSQWALENYDKGRGWADNAEDAADADVFLCLHDWLRGESDPIPKLDGLIEQNPNITVVCDEVGCGVVPLDSAVRAWRERVGRTCCHLAEKADTVLRLWCGIPTVLKGEKE